MSFAAVLLAIAAVVVAPISSGLGCRAGLQGARTATPVGSSLARADPLAAAFTLDVLAACLRSGMAVSTAAAATAPSAPPALALTC